MQTRSILMNRVDPNMSQTILVVDDKANVRRLIADYLGEQGYRTIVAENGRDALFAARQDPPDLILLDIMMPEMDGYDFIRTYRQTMGTPIILLTARMEEMDKVVGLELGADDYVTKPFGMRELLARIRAVLRRGGQEGQRVNELRAGPLMLSHERREVEVEGRSVHLTPSEFSILASLMSAPGRVFSRMELLEALPGDAFEGAERTVDVHVRHLRKKIETDPGEPRFVETVFGAGYRLRKQN